MIIEQNDSPISTSLAPIYQEDLPDQHSGNLVLEIHNKGSNPLDEFHIYLRDHLSGEFYPYLGNTDFTTTSENLTFISTNPPHTLAGGSKSHVHINIRSAIGIAFFAKAVAETTISVKGSLM